MPYLSPKPGMVMEVIKVAKVMEMTIVIVVVVVTRIVLEIVVKLEQYMVGKGKVELVEIM